MRHAFITFTVSLIICNRLVSQCPSYLYAMYEEPIVICPVINIPDIIGPYAGSQVDWLYSWSPSTNLNNPNICNPYVSATSGSDITYTLTIETPGCAPFVAGSIRVMGQPTPTLSPTGPISYYYQYEGTQYLVLTSDQPRSNWYKNGSTSDHIVKTWWADGSNMLTIPLTGLGTGTDYYKLDNGYQCTEFSNVVAITYHGVDDDGDYPVTHNSHPCGSIFPWTITQPNLGAGTSYNYDLVYGGSNFSVTGISGNTATLNKTGACSYPLCLATVVTRAVKPDGTEVRMALDWNVNTGCRVAYIAPPEEALKKEMPLVSGLRPNPAQGHVSVTAPSAIQRIELYTSQGQLLNAVTGNGLNIQNVSLNGLAKGIIMCKVYFAKGSEMLKLLVK